MNPIIKAHLEGMEQFKGITAQGYITTRNSHKVLDPELLMDIEEVVQCFLTTYAESLLKAVKRVGKEETWSEELMERVIDTQTYINAWNDYRSFIHSAIDEGIEGIKNS